MGWFQRILGREERANIENPSVPLSSYVPPFTSAGPSPAGVNVTAEKALMQTRVWAAMSRISETVASLPWQIYSDTADGRMVAKEHPFYQRIWLRPNDDISSFTFRQVFVAHMYMYGNGYALITRDGSNRARSLLLLLPDQVRRVRENGDVYYYVKDVSRQEEARYPASDMIHVQGFSMDGICGLSTVMLAARNAIGLALATEEHTSRLFSNGARPGGVLKHPGSLSAEAAKRVIESWNQAQGGLANAYKTALLEEGMDWQQLGLSANDAQSEEQRRFQTEEIAAAFNIPPIFLGDHTHSTFSNNEQQDLHFSKHTIHPVVTRIEQEFNWKLFKGTPFFCEFNMDGLERGSFESRINGLVQAVQGGISTPNEARKKLNMPPKAGGDELYLQQNMSDLQNLGEMQGQQPEGGSDE